MPESGQMIREIAFEMAASSVRFGAGVTREVGMDLVDLGVRTGAGRHRSQPDAARTCAARCSPRSTPRAWRRCCTTGCASSPPTCRSATRSDFAEAHPVDGIVAVGGGSVIDTAKAVNLYTTYPPADFLDYVNAPIGKAMPVPGPLKPLIAIPTTAGTGSETTGVSIFDLTEMHAKTGIASRRLKPTLGLLDPENTRTMPPQVAASSGLDILSHAIESFTATPYTSRPRPERPALRPAYQGSNPISDIWALQALRIVTQYLVRAVEDPSDDDARAQMILAASYAGMGFGNAGVHLPHGMSYPVSGHVKNYHAPGYPERSPARPARDLGDPQRAGRLPVHGGRQSRATSASRRGARRQCDGREGGRCRKDSRGSPHLVHGAARRAQRVEGAWATRRLTSPASSRERCRSTA